MKIKKFGVRRSHFRIGMKCFYYGVWFKLPLKKRIIVWAKEIKP